MQYFIFTFAFLDGSTAVHRACHDSSSDCLKLLAEYNAKLDIQDNQGRAPIHWACTTKHTECLKVGTIKKKKSTYIHLELHKIRNYYIIYI